MKNHETIQHTQTQFYVVVYTGGMGRVLGGHGSCFDKQFLKI